MFLGWVEILVVGWMWRALLFIIMYWQLNMREISHLSLSHKKSQSYSPPQGFWGLSWKSARAEALDVSKNLVLIFAASLIFKFCAKTWWRRHERYDDKLIFLFNKWRRNNDRKHSHRNEMLYKRIGVKETTWKTFLIPIVEFLVWRFRACLSYLLTILSSNDVSSSWKSAWASLSRHRYLKASWTRTLFNRWEIKLDQLATVIFYTFKRSTSVYSTMFYWNHKSY